MKKIVLFSALLIAAISCVKEDLRQESFSYKWNDDMKTVTTYTSFYTDSTFEIYGAAGNDSLHFFISRGGNKGMAGYYPLGSNSPHYLEIKKDGNKRKALQGGFDLEYINFYSNFKFDAIFSDGDTLENGNGNNIRINRGDSTLIFQ
ncbi:MAG: hypothetical protein N4A45_11725 [Flavobacteriales bacterium]|jgi:hypothetical protein|nr:hypothetical protein [Flavobacteriales bacterium]